MAATNHQGLLDRALWRRFDEVVCFEPPSNEQIRELLRIKLRAVRTDLPLDRPDLAQRFFGMSHADVERVVVRAIKGMVLGGRQFLSEDILAQALERELARQNATTGSRSRKQRSHSNKHNK